MRPYFVWIRQACQFAWGMAGGRRAGCHTGHHTGRYTGRHTGRHMGRRLSLLLLLFCSSLLGLGLAGVSSAQLPPAAGPATSEVPANPTGTVDVVTEPYRLGQQYYLENCATCHVGLPPAVMPSQTWAALLPDSQHYGAQIKPLTEPLLQIVWSYVSTYSRPILQRERIPFRLQQSRLFKALHPKVEFTEPVTVNSCQTCHPAARQFNYRELSAEWQDGA